MKPVSLRFPFAVLGAAGGWLVVNHSLIGPGDAALRVLLPTVTPISSYLLGWFLEKHLVRRTALEPRGVVVCALLVILSTVLAGILNGAAIGACVAGPAGLLFGGLFGIGYALPFVPATLAISLVARQVRAPEHTPVGRAQRNGIWAMTALCVAVAVPLTISSHAGGHACVTLALAACAASILVLVSDVRVLYSLRRLAARIGGMTRRQRSLPMMVETGAQRIELGAGDAIFDEVERGEPFRGVDRLVRVVHGEPSQAAGAAGRALVRDAVFFVLAVASLLLFVR